MPNTNDPHAIEKMNLMRRFGGNLIAALDDPFFNGSAAAKPDAKTRSKNPILLAGERPLKGSLIGPRICVLKVNAGLHAERLLSAAERKDCANLRALVPWNFIGSPRVTMDGKLIHIEVPWPDDPDPAKSMHYTSIPLAPLIKNNVRDGEAAVVGVSTSGETITIRLDKLHPHLLIGGTTGAGKSETMKLLAGQFAQLRGAKFIFCDPQNKTFEDLNGIRGQIGPIATSRTEITNALGAAWAEMMRRSNMPGDVKHAPLYIFFDEFDVFTSEDKDISRLVYLLSKMGRKCRVHLILATQTPRQTMFIDKGIKAQLALRLALPVTSSLESRVILEKSDPDANTLCGPGDAYVTVIRRSGSILERVQVAILEGGEFDNLITGEIEWSVWPTFNVDALDDNDVAGSNAVPFSNEEAVVGMAAAWFSWGAHKTKRVMNDVLGYKMGQGRIEERLMDLGGKLSELWRRLQEEAKENNHAG